MPIPQRRRPYNIEIILVCFWIFHYNLEITVVFKGFSFVLRFHYDDVTTNEVYCGLVETIVVYYWILH